MNENPPDPIVSSDVFRQDRLPPGQRWAANDAKTGKAKWPVLHAGGVPIVDNSTWTLRIFGLVEQSVELDWEAFSKLPTSRVHCDIHCVTRWSRQDNVFEGKLVRTVLGLVTPLPSATHVMIHAHSTYPQPFTTNLPLDAFSGDDCLFATHHDGQPLTPEHGGPVRLVIPKHYFWKSAKWVKGVEFMNDDRPGFWERNGYHMFGDPWQKQRHDDD